MPTLAQLLASRGSLLVLDAASTRVQVGLLRAGSGGVWRNREGEAGSALFADVQAVLDETSVKLDDIGAFVFCDGPGSMLGTRTIAMAIRTWQVLKPRPVYAYHSLTVAGRLAWTQAPRALAVIADARRETWHVQNIAADGTVAPLQRVAPANLPDTELLTPENFRAWATPPRPVAACSYDLARIFPAISGQDFLRAVDAADTFQHEEPEYRKWSAQVHSAATAAPR